MQVFQPNTLWFVVDDDKVNINGFEVWKEAMPAFTNLDNRIVGVVPRGSVILVGDTVVYEDPWGRKYNYVEVLLPYPGYANRNLFNRDSLRLRKV